MTNNEKFISALIVDAAKLHGCHGIDFDKQLSIVQARLDDLKQSSDSDGSALIINEYQQNLFVETYRRGKELHSLLGEMEKTERYEKFRDTGMPSCLSKAMSGKKYTEALLLPHDCIKFSKRPVITVPAYNGEYLTIAYNTLLVNSDSRILLTEEGLKVK